VCVGSLRGDRTGRRDAIPPPGSHLGSGLIAHQFSERGRRTGRPTCSGPGAARPTTLVQCWGRVRKRRLRAVARVTEPGRAATADGRMRSLVGGAHKPCHSDDSWYYDPH
jgi:hypothetical protein